jgi:hypothetical protein
VQFDHVGSSTFCGAREPIWTSGEDEGWVWRKAALQGLGLGPHLGVLCARRCVVALGRRPAWPQVRGCPWCGPWSGECDDEGKGSCRRLQYLNAWAERRHCGGSGCRHRCTGVGRRGKGREDCVQGEARQPLRSSPGTPCPPSMTLQPPPLPHLVFFFLLDA